MCGLPSAATVSSRWSSVKRKRTFGLFLGVVAAHPPGIAIAAAPTPSILRASLRFMPGSL